jgi:hypothetical protein
VQLNLALARGFCNLFLQMRTDVMKNLIKKSICVLLCISTILTFSACSKVEVTDESVTQTVEKVEKALQEFDTETLEKYVDSSTLNYILSFAKNHQQFVDLGVAIFENLSIEIDSIDLENKEVTVSVTNKSLSFVASTFAYDLKNNYSTLQLLKLLDSDNFLDTSLSELTQDIADCVMNDTAIQVTLTIEEGKKNLILGFDEDAEDAVSGGALGAIKSIIGS